MPSAPLWYSLLLLTTLAAAAHGQDPHVSTDAPADQPYAMADQASMDDIDRRIKPCVVAAQKSLPAARKRFEEGLPAQHSLFVVTRLHNRDGRWEQVFVAVDGFHETTVRGRIWSTISVVDGYKFGQPYSFEEADVLDWLVTRPDGTEEGNLVGRFMDLAQQKGREAMVCDPTIDY